MCKGELNFVGFYFFFADAPPAPSAEELAAEEERLRQEEEMVRQVQEMREELARVYERDLVTFFDLYLALSQPV